ncbi:MAG: hypothetical protein AAF740_01405 [Bacteroidota bacterium]
MKPLYLLVILFFLGTGYSYAQLGLRNLSLDYRILKRVDLDYQDIKGHPFLDRNFRDAMVNKEKYPVRYDIYKDEMQVKVEEGRVIAIDESTNFNILFLDDSATFIPTELENGKRGYVQLLWENEEKTAALFKRYEVKYSVGSAGNGITGDKPAHFTEIKSRLYFRELKNYRLVRLPRNRKRVFQEVFGVDLRQAAKENNLDPLKESDLVELLKLHYK